MESKKERIVVALGGSALGNTPPEQMKAVKITAKIIVDLIEEGCEVAVAYGNDPQVGMTNNVMAILSREDANQSSTPLSACVAMSQAYIGYDLQNALREELYNREIYDIPVTTMITRVRVDADDSAFEAPFKPIDHFIIEEQAKIAEDKYGYTMKEDSGRGFCRVVASPEPAEITETGTIRSPIDSGQLVIACGGGGIPITRQGDHLKGAGAVIDGDFTSGLLTENLNTDFLIILIVVEKVVINLGRLEEKWPDDLNTEEARQYIKEGCSTPGSMLPKVQTTVKFVRSKPGRAALIMLLEKAKDDI